MASERFGVQGLEFRVRVLFFVNPEGEAHVFLGYWQICFLEEEANPKEAHGA